MPLHAYVCMHITKCYNDDVNIFNQFVSAYIEKYVSIIYDNINNTFYNEKIADIIIKLYDIPWYVCMYVWYVCMYVCMFILVVFIATQKFSAVQSKRLRGKRERARERARERERKRERKREREREMPLKSFFLTLAYIHVLQTNPLKSWVKGLYIGAV